MAVSPLSPTGNSCWLSWEGHAINKYSPEHTERMGHLLVQSDWKHQITIVGDQSVNLCLTLSSKHYVDTYKDRNLNIYQHYKETFLLNGSVKCSNCVYIGKMMWQWMSICIFSSQVFWGVLPFCLFLKNLQVTQMTILYFVISSRITAY